MDVFPIEPSHRYGYQDRFDAREGGHHGTDIFAPRGTPVVAVESGTAHGDTNPKGGNTVYLLGGDTGTRYYYAHLDTVAAPLDVADPRKLVNVQAGDVLGTVGTTGNAQGKDPHLHFQLKLVNDVLLDPFIELQRVDPRRRAHDALERGVATATAEWGTAALLVLGLIALQKGLTKNGR